MAAVGPLIADGERLTVLGVPLHAGDLIEIAVAGAWVRARVEWDPQLGWYAILPQLVPDDGASRLRVVLRAGTWVRTR